MIKVLIVEDSPVARALLKHILSGDPEIEVIGEVTNGEEAIEFLSRQRPDVVTMDVIMPKMDGLEATRRIMQTQPLPIVVVSASLNRAEVNRTFKALEAGAVAALEKPRTANSLVQGSDAERLVKTVKAMSQVKVIRRWGRPVSADKPKRAAVRESVPGIRRDIRVVAMGASTGGPDALRRILSLLPSAFPCPILLVQHISPGFTVGFVDWLNKSCSLTVRLAADTELALPGHVYVAPDGLEMTIDRGLRIRLVGAESMNGNVPSASCLFRSVAEAVGARAVGVLLTGMGRDGAPELKLMRDRGAITLAQNEETSVVYGMPGEAMKLGAVEHSLSPEDIAQMLERMVRKA